MATETSTATSYPTAYETSGSISGTKYRNAIGKGSDTSAVSGNDYASGGSSSKAYIFYSFDFSSIPDAATIDSVECTVKGHAENTSRSTCNLQLYAGTSTAKGSSSKFTSTSAQTLTLTTGTWTVAEVKDMRLRFEIGYYGGLVNGATVTVTYTWNSTKWRITVSNSTSVAVTASDSEVYDGSSATITAASLDGITVTDNGTDVTDQFVEKQETGASYEVETAGNYGFALNSSGYYQSENKGISKTAALCKVNVHVPVDATLTFTYINYAEQGYDFGVFGNIDVALSDDYYSAGSSGATITDSSYKLACNTSSHNTSSVQTLDYELTAGDHFIYVKYSKDDASDANNDTLQFKLAITLDEPFTPSTYWAYTIANVTTDHAIVVAKESTTALYVKQGSAWVQVTRAYRKVNGSWQEVALDAAFSAGTRYRRA